MLAARRTIATFSFNYWSIFVGDWLVRDVGFWVACVGCEWLDFGIVMATIAAALGGVGGIGVDCCRSPDVLVNAGDGA